jgi:hypothetical protein
MKQVLTNIGSLDFKSLHRSDNYWKFLSKYRLITLFTCLSVIVCSCQKGDPFNLFSEHHKTTVPFKANFETTDIATTFVGNIQYDNILGTGYGTPIGKATDNVHAEGDTTLPFPALVTAKGTLTAENGDQIFTTSIGYVNAPDANGVLHLKGNATIIGGTGKYTGATGKLIVMVTQNIENPAGTESLEGTITY